MTRRRFGYIIGFAILFTLFFSVKANAISLSSEEIFTRILVNNFQYCFQNALTGEIMVRNYGDFNTLMNDGFKNAWSVQHEIRIPELNNPYNKITQISPEDKGRVTSCYALLYRDQSGSGLNGEMKGLLEIYNVNVPTGSSDTKSLNDFMVGKLKYDSSTEQASSNEYCYTVYVRPKTTVDSSVNLGSYCRNEDNYPISSVDKIFFTGGDDGAEYLVTGSYKIPVGNVSAADSKPIQITVASSKKMCYDGGHGQVACSVTLSFPVTTPSEGISMAAKNIYWDNQPDIYIEVKKNRVSSEDSRNLLYIKDNSKWKESLAAITNNGYTDRVAFSDVNKYDFYLQYLSTYYKLDGVPIGSSICQAEKPSVIADTNNNKYYIFIKDNGWCLANLAENKLNVVQPMSVFTNNERYRLNKVINTLSELINSMGELDYSSVNDFPTIDESGTGTVPGNTEESSNEVPVTCASSGGAESLGWIVCPILSWMGNAAKDMYGLYIEPALNVKTVLFNEEDGKNDDVKDAWSFFQNVANVVFTILFLVVIFSQLTGVGIDNYGIKKVLPKIIIAAVLVNISYYICLVFIDLSNIIGNGVQSIFNGMGSSLEINDVVIGGMDYGKSIVSTGITGAVLLGALTVGGVAIWRNPAILLTLLISGIGVIISILTLFVILSAREAAVVILTVISPLAFVCYILPNTKTLFDRWLKAGQGLLLVYPICSLLVGGGGYVSKLLLAIGANTDADGTLGFFSIFSAMLISVVPIFFIPIVLKNSFAAMGNLGAKISGWGEKVRGGVTRKARESSAYKAAQERGLERRTRIRAGISKDGQAKDVSGFGRFMRGGKRDMARSRAQYLKNQDARTREDSLMDVGFAAAVIGQEKKAERDELSDYMTLINDKTRNGEDEETLFGLYDDYLKGGNKAGAIAIARIAGRRKDTAARFINQKITGTGLDATKVREMTNMNSANSGIFRSVAKEISTGENSGNYRESSPFGFEFAAQHNRNAGTDISYGNWVGQNTDGTAGAGNIHSAFENHITNSKELVGMKNSSLQELLSYRNRMSESDKIRLQKMADDTINNRANTGIWDTTKAENIYKLAGREAEYQTMFGVASNSSTAVAGETFMVRGQNGDVTFTQGTDGQWRDESGRVVEDFERFRKGVEASRNKKQ